MPAPTTQEIRDQYLANQLFLLGEKFGGLEVIDRRANYIVVVDEAGQDKKMFLEEAYTLYTSAKELAAKLSPESSYAKPEADMHAQLKKVYDEYPEYHEAGFDAMVKKFAGDNFYNMHHVAKAYLGEQIVEKSASKRTNFSTFSATLNEGLFTYKGFRGKHITENHECALVFHGLTESCDDPWALLSAIRATEAFFEHRTPGTLDRARQAVARIDDVSNHPWLLEARNPIVMKVDPTSDDRWGFTPSVHHTIHAVYTGYGDVANYADQYFHVEDEDGNVRVLSNKDPSNRTEIPADNPIHELVRNAVKNQKPLSENKSVFTIQQKFDLLDEDCDFEIAEALTYSGFRTVLTEDFEREIHKTLSKLEKNPKELEELTDNIRTIADIAHHYDKHSVHMKEGFGDVAKAVGKYATAGAMAGVIGLALHAGMENDEAVQDHHAAVVSHIAKKSPEDAKAYQEHVAAYKKNKVGVNIVGKTQVTHGNAAEAEKHKAAASEIAKKHGLLESVEGVCKSCGRTRDDHNVRHIFVEDAEEKAITHAEKTKKISVRKLSSGTQLVKIAKRAAVELIAQKLANKPIKKISKKEKNVILTAIKSKKHVVLKLAKKLMPKIKAIEHEHHEHEHEGARGTDSRGEFGSAGA